MIRVMLVDDQEMIRAGLRAILDAHPGLTVVAEAGDGAAAIAILGTVEVDVVLMDINMPRLNGVDATRRIREGSDVPYPRILMLTTFDEDENVLAALRAGADGFFSKGASPTALTQGVVDVHEGRHALSPSAIQALVGHVSTPATMPVDADAEALFSALTEREREIVVRVVEGLSNEEIGRLLFISPLTVKTHVNRAMMKVGVSDRARLVSLAVQAGFRP